VDCSEAIVNILLAQFVDGVEMLVGGDTALSSGCRRGCCMCSLLNLKVDVVMFSSGVPSTTLVKMVCLCLVA